MKGRLRGFICRALTLLALSLALPVTAHAEERSALGPSILRVPRFEQEAEQGILTPVPLDLELPAELPARRVLVHYRIHGSKDWTTLELLRHGKRWFGAIPCLEVSTITGDISYYIRVHDGAGAVIAYSGSRHRPYRVTIRHDSTRTRTDEENENGPSADGDRARNRCPDPADCPPGLLGCPSAQVERIPCRSDDDCEGELSCGWDGFCELDRRSNDWLGLELDAGLGVVSGTGACSVPNQENEGYACYRADGELYTGLPVYTNEPLAVGTTPVRIVLAYERLISEHALLGARFGYALFGEGPTPRGGSEFVPYSAELRAVHVFGHDPFASTGIKPYALVSAGYAMYDVKVDVRVRHDLRQAVDQGGNDLEQTLEVWRRAGDAFIGLGSGLLWITSPGFALSTELRATQSFPFNALVISGSLGARVGF